MNTTFGSILYSKIKMLLNSLHIQYFFCIFAIRKHMFHPKTIENMIISILVLLATVAMFIIGKIRADIVALCALTILILCGNIVTSGSTVGILKSGGSNDGGAICSGWSHIADRTC